jgi:hypothetical protein
LIMGWNFLLQDKKTTKNPMIESIVSKFQSFRNRLFQLLYCRADATMDLIDATAAEVASSSVVKLSLSSLFRRSYSSITDVLSNVFTPLPTKTSEEQALAVTQLLAEEAPPTIGAFSLFAIDCTANPRIYSEKVIDRSVVHAPNHVPGQKPITVGHEYSVIVHIPDEPVDRDRHWVIPLSVKRVASSASGPQVGLLQFKQIATQTQFRDCFCVDVADAAYSTGEWLAGIADLHNAVHIARLRGNRTLFRAPQEANRRRGRPILYGDEVPLCAPSEPDEQLEQFELVTRRGKKLFVKIVRWNDLLAKGRKDLKTHLHPFDVVRITVTDEKGRPIYKRPLWLMIAGQRRREITNRQAFQAYCCRYDIEHFFRFGKQKLCLTSSQTCETRHEENWLWISMLAYTMLYHASSLAKETRYPWERKKVTVIKPKQTPTMVQRDYERIIRGIGTPASVPKPRGKSSGREGGVNGKRRKDQPLVRKAMRTEGELKKRRCRKGKAGPKIPCQRLRRIWKNDS